MKKITIIYIQICLYYYIGKKIPKYYKNLLNINLIMNYKNISRNSKKLIEQNNKKKKSINKI